MKKCFKCLKKVPYSYFSQLKGIDIKDGRVKCPHCKEFNYITKESLVDFSHVITMPFFIMFFLLFAPISFGGYLIAIVLVFMISKFTKGMFIDFSEKDPFEESIKK